MKFYVTGDLQVSQHISEGSILSLMLTYVIYFYKKHISLLLRTEDYLWVIGD